MKAARVLAFVFVGIGAITGAVVFGQSAPEKAKAPLPEVQPRANSNAFPNNGQPNYVIQELAPGGPGFFVPGSQDQSSQLVDDYVKAKEEDKKEIRKKLADVLGKQFDAHMKQQDDELTALEKQINDLKELMKKRLAAKTTIIDRRMDQLIQDAEGLGWTAPGSPNHAGALFQANPQLLYRSSTTGRAPSETKKAPRKQGIE